MESSIAIVNLYMFGVYDLTELQLHRRTEDLQLDAFIISLPTVSIQSL